MPPLSTGELMAGMLAGDDARHLVGLALAGAMLLWPGVTLAWRIPGRWCGSG
jgi:ABC-2 type transport system permease protein